MKRIIILLVLAGIAGGSGYWYWHNANDQKVSFRMTAVIRGDLLATVNATGTIEPEEVIDVGAQVQGKIDQFGHDLRDTSKFIDYGSPVKKDTVLAQIDRSLYQAQLDQANARVEEASAALVQAKAQVDQANANQKRAEADLGQMQAKLYQSDRDYFRARQLTSTKAIADVDYDTAEATYRTNKATLAVGEAAIDQAKASVKDANANVVKTQAALTEAEAAKKNAQINLDYCTIKSPVEGVIIDRRVNVGQTVVSSLSAPSLFLIAKDLKKLQVWASVNEADIGHIASGQRVSFTVDAFPGETFHGTVAPDQPRLNANMTQNVVTYTVVVNTGNPDGKLKPYMTANLQFEIKKHENVLLVPNSALRWKPTPPMVVPEARQDFIASQRRKGAPGEKPVASAEKQSHDKGTLWVEDSGFVRPVKVRIGLSDGIQTEILSGDIQADTKIVVGEARPTDTAQSSNPFAPKVFGKK